MRELTKSFFERDTEKVAEDLLGKILVKKTDNSELSGKIVETEAYFGPEDPASRASNGKTKISKVMWEEPGTILVYVVHSHDLINFITEEKGTPGAVLIRAIEPLEGKKIMKRRRERKNIYELCSGPGKLTEAFGISKEYNMKKINETNLRIIKNNEEVEIGCSSRIGVKEDLPGKYRFFIKNNKFLSR